LPDTVWKLAACNPPDCAANGSELEPPLANRLCHLTWETDSEAWQRGMGNALGFPQPSFVPLPPDWEKCVGRNTGLVGAFHKHKPGLLEAYPKDRAKHPGRGPRCASGPTAALRARWSDRRRAVGAIGPLPVAWAKRRALEFQTEQSSTCPDPEAWLAKANAARRGDRASLTFHRVAISHGALVALVIGEESQPWSQRQAHGRALAGGGGLLC
jgi:hypothetical protein